MDNEPKNEVISKTETAVRIAELKRDPEKIAIIMEHLPELEADLRMICATDFADLNDPTAYIRVEEYQELIGSGTRGAVQGVEMEMHRSILYRIDTFLDKYGV